MTDDFLLGLVVGAIVGVVVVGLYARKLLREADEAFQRMKRGMEGVLRIGRGGER